jgi:hypothetical protein
VGVLLKIYPVGVVEAKSSCLPANFLGVVCWCWLYRGQQCDASVCLGVLVKEGGVWLSAVHQPDLASSL